MRRGRTITLTALLALGAGAVAGCAQDNPVIEPGGNEDAGEGHDPQGTATILGEEATNHGETDVSGETEAEMELDDSYFGPTIWRGEPGQQLTLALHNEGAAPHTFTLDEAGLDVELEPGEEGSVDLTFPESGTVAFYCRFHRAQGMVGAATVDGEGIEASGGGDGHGDHSGGDDDSGREDY